jgi:hypothetical protein
MSYRRRLAQIHPSHGHRVAQQDDDFAPRSDAVLALVPG